jgi:cytochrome c-type biogenesis protein CcsB
MRRLILLALALGAIAMAAAPAADEFGALWRETGFDRVAVQSWGLPKTMATFARDELRGITLRRLIHGEDQITLALQLIARPGALADRAIIPVEGDDLVPVLISRGLTVKDRTLRLGDCLRFDAATGQIVGEGPAMELARAVAMGNTRGTPLQAAGERLFSRINQVVELASALRVFPDPENPKGAWANLDEADHHGSAQAGPARQDLHALLAAVGAGDVAAARPVAERLTGELTALPNYPSSTRLAVDYAYTTRKPFFWASFLYVLSAALFFVSLVTDGKRWWWAAAIAMGAGWVINILGAAARGYLLGRMPLSNLYEATTTGIAFIIFFALILEIMYRPRIIGLSAGMLSFIYYRWLVSSDAFGNDAIEPLRAVLNSYWLDYHVTTMMLSYGAFTIAFTMSVLYLLRAQWPRLMAWAPPAESLDLYTYRAIQFGWPLLGIGIVLGAVWADTAWGRMWSWDPKETWALITWLIYTGYLHVRLVHGWKGSAMAWASIVGYGAVAFTYLGVNFILSGLHSYAGSGPVITLNPMTLIQRHWPTLLVIGLIVAGAVFLVVWRRRHTPMPADPGRGRSAPAEVPAER